MHVDRLTKFMFLNQRRMMMVRSKIFCCKSMRRVWPRVGLTIVLAAVLAAASAGCALALGRWRDGMPATLVLGQADFSGSLANRGGSADALGYYVAQSVAVDPTTGKIFIADCGNNRVLRYPKEAALANGAAAEAVLGQPDFTSVISTTTQSGMACPNGLFVDANGTLWEAEWYNNRVMRFDHAASKANGAAADGVLGQPDFTSKAPATTQQGMGNPGGLFVDANGTLWQVDNQNNRVLRFDHAASKANGAAADGVLGQPGFTTANPAATRNGMSGPGGVWVSNGALFVGEMGNNRVLRFDKAAAKANGADADGVLGQPDFTTVDPGCTKNKMNTVYDISVDAVGALYVVEFSNNRVLIFDGAAALANGAAASHVLGQPDFTTCSEGSNANRLSGPTGVFADAVEGTLWVAEYNNNRVLRFQSR
jgi:sugar lactone lactonase YvrE